MHRLCQMVMRVLEESEAEEADWKHWDRVTILSKWLVKPSPREWNLNWDFKGEMKEQIVYTPGERALVKKNLFLSGPVSSTYIDQRGSGQ